MAASRKTYQPFVLTRREWFVAHMRDLCRSDIDLVHRFLILLIISTRAALERADATNTQAHSFAPLCIEVDGILLLGLWKY